MNIEEILKKHNVQNTIKMEQNDAIPLQTNLISNEQTTPSTDTTSPQLNNVENSTISDSKDYIQPNPMKVNPGLSTITNDSSQINVQNVLQRHAVSNQGLLFAQSIQPSKVSYQVPTLTGLSSKTAKVDGKNTSTPNIVSNLATLIGSMISTEDINTIQNVLKRKWDVDQYQDNMALVTVVFRVLSRFFANFNDENNPTEKPKPKPKVIDEIIFAC